MKKNTRLLNRDLKIAIVHDALMVPAGSERVALQISNLFPEAPIFTSAYDPDNTFPEFKNKTIHTLPFSSLIRGERHFKSLYPLWLLELSLLDLSNFDLVISSANYLAKFINIPKHTTHICYLHNPIRFLWKPRTYTKDSVPMGNMGLSVVKFLQPGLQRYDIWKTQRIDHIIANSKNISNQIEGIYQRQAEVIYPPVDVNSFQVSDDPGSFYLYAGRLISHKRADIAINACKKLGCKLVVAGDGFERHNLEKIAEGGDIEFTGRISDQQLQYLYANCKALLFPSDEDFGLVPVEAQACGRPVIAFRSGGTLETVLEGETGVFFNEQNEESLIEAIHRFETMSFDSLRIKQNAMKFDISVFRNKFLNYIDEIMR